MPRTPRTHARAPARPEGRGSALVPLALLVVVVSAALLWPGSARAQAPITDGTYSISFGFDGGSAPVAGIWYSFGRVNMGLLGAVDWARTRQDDGQQVESLTTIAAGPRAKWYLQRPPPVVPFWFGGIDLLLERRSRPDGTTSRSTGVGFQGGLGADWFPLDDISIGGWTGLDLGFVSERDADRSTTRLRTLTAGLSVHLYF